MVSKICLPLLKKAVFSFRQLWRSHVEKTAHSFQSYLIQPIEIKLIKIAYLSGNPMKFLENLWFSICTFQMKLSKRALYNVCCIFCLPSDKNSICYSRMQHKRIDVSDTQIYSCLDESSLLWLARVFKKSRN